jgi:hypothetical protein
MKSGPDDVELPSSGRRHKCNDKRQQEERTDDGVAGRMRSAKTFTVSGRRPTFVISVALVVLTVLSSFYLRLFFY